jgi:hypothetical protein
MTISVTMSNVGMGIYHENRELSNDELVCEGTYNMLYLLHLIESDKTIEPSLHIYVRILQGDFFFFYVIHGYILSYCQFLCFFYINIF